MEGEDPEIVQLLMRAMDKANKKVKGVCNKCVLYLATRLGCV